MDFFVWTAAVLLVLIGFAVCRVNKRKRPVASAPLEPVEKNAFKVSYVPSDIAWSGSTSGTLPLKTLTYKQYECLEDARYGFKVVGVTPSARKNEQPLKTRAHGKKTVASLVRHGFLSLDSENAYVITDHGLNALEVCDVRY